MKILFYSTKEYEQPFLEAARKEGMETEFIAPFLSMQTASRAQGFDAVSIFTGDDASRPVLQELFRMGVKWITVRAAGYDNVDLSEAAALELKVANVPEYSPHAIAEHAVALMLALNRKIVLANKQVHQWNFTASGLVGFDLYKKTVGIIGVGKIGAVLARIMHGFGCRLLGSDLRHDADLVDLYNLKYVGLAELCRKSDIISIHTPLNVSTRYLVNRDLIELMRPGTMLINMGRGACVNTSDLLKGLDSGAVGSYGADVYERESELFFRDHGGSSQEDPVLEDLLSRPNVLITPHQAFATREALTNIAETTYSNIKEWNQSGTCKNELRPAPPVLSSGIHHY